MFNDENNAVIKTFETNVSSVQLKVSITEAPQESDTVAVTPEGRVYDVFFLPLRKRYWVISSYIFNGQEWGLGGHQVEAANLEKAIDECEQSLKYFQIHFQNGLVELINTLQEEWKAWYSVFEESKESEQGKEKNFLEWAKSSWWDARLKAQKRRLRIKNRGKGDKVTDSEKYPVGIIKLFMEKAQEIHNICGVIWGEYQEKKQTEPNLHKSIPILNELCHNYPIDKETFQKFCAKYPNFEASHLTYSQAAKATGNIDPLLTKNRFLGIIKLSKETLRLKRTRKKK